MPEVSVIMNCYNGERYLRAAIDSVLEQTYQDWELIFWDNASTDGSAAVVASYPDPRIRYFRGERNVPLGEARGLALAQARGAWVGFLDTDDLWYPHKLARQMAALADTGHVLCYSAIHEISPDGALIRTAVPAHPTGDLFERQLVQYDINLVSPLLRRSALERHGLQFNPAITASEEYNLFLRLIAHGTVCVIDEPLAAWRIGSGTLTDRQMACWADERFATLDQLEAENPGITARHARAFRIARARGDYYRARYLMQSGDATAARAALAAVRDVDPAYRILHALTYSRWAWAIAHSTALKRKWLPRLWALVASK